MAVTDRKDALPMQPPDLPQDHLPATGNAAVKVDHAVAACRNCGRMRARARRRVRSKQPGQLGVLAVERAAALANGGRISMCTAVTNFTAKPRAPPALGTPEEHAAARREVNDRGLQNPRAALVGTGDERSAGDPMKSVGPCAKH